MEIHHSHHPTHKKKWTGYLLEFFMLFLAVFLGFLAENIRENVVERHKEREYIKSMIADLKEDTTRIRSFLNVTGRYQRGRDSLIDLLQKPLTNPDTIKKAYRLAYKYAFGRAKFYFTDRTMTQLKNAGGLRLIRNGAASDSIIGYDRKIQHVEYLSDAYETAVNDGMSSSYDIFNFSYELNPELINRTDFMPDILTTDRKIIVRYLNSLIKWNSVSGNYFTQIEEQKKTAVRLINTLQKEYHL